MTKLRVIDNDFNRTHYRDLIGNEYDSTTVPGYVNVEVVQTEPEDLPDSEDELGNLYVRETYTNETKGHMIGESDWFETFTDKLGVLFLDLQREYGRCISKMYIDLRDGGVRQLGWVFEKRMQYEDARSNKPEDFYIRQVWVEVSRTQPHKTTQVLDVTSPWEKAKVSA